MPKARHNGTCQCCGDTFAVNAKTGRLAKHGYRVMWNQEVGQCPGAYELPLEVDCSIAKRLLADLHKAEAEYVALGGEDPRTAQKVHVGYWHSGREKYKRSSLLLMETRQGIKWLQEIVNNWTPSALLKRVGGAA